MKQVLKNLTKVPPPPKIPHIVRFYSNTKKNDVHAVMPAMERAA